MTETVISYSQFTQVCVFVQFCALTEPLDFSVTTCLLLSYKSFSQVA